MPLLAPVTIATRPSSHPMATNNKRSAGVLVFQGRVLAGGLLSRCKDAIYWHIVDSHVILLADSLLEVAAESDMFITRFVASAGLVAALTVAASPSAFAQRARAVPRGSVRGGPVYGGGVRAGRPVVVAPYRGFYGYRSYVPHVNLSFFYGRPGFYGAYGYGNPFFSYGYPYYYGYPAYASPYPYPAYGYGYVNGYAPYGYGYGG